MALFGGPHFVYHPMTRRCRIVGKVYCLEAIRGLASLSFSVSRAVKVSLSVSFIFPWSKTLTVISMPLT